MEEREKGGEEGKKQEFLGLKLRRGVLVGKSKGGVCTPPPTWTFQPHFLQNLEEQDPHFCGINSADKNNIGSCSSTVTARQLGANLWEILPHLQSLARMSHHRKGGERFSCAQKNKGLEMKAVPEDPPDTQSDEQPVSTGSFHRQIAASLMRHHRIVDRTGRALRPVSPASYGSSMEITPYNPAASPGSSIEYKGSLKTSTELLKVLNRIWYLEEQHSINVSRVKAVKMDLENARKRIKELLKEKQMDKQVIEDLMKQVAESKLVKKSMDQDRMQCALQSVREELEDERKLRKRSESLHRKLAREISEIKSSFSRVVNDLDRERRARILLEDLCDEFAMGIRDYEQELRSLKHRADKEQVHREHVDSLVLHISEAWLDERVQMKLAEETRKDEREKSMIVDKLKPEIETFLKARQALYVKEHFDLQNKNSKGSGLRRQSLESFPLNEAKSAPQDADDEDDSGSGDSDSHCFELNDGIHPRNANVSDERGLEETVKLDTTKRKGEPQEVGNGRSLSSLQARFEKHMAKVISGEAQKGGTHLESNTSSHISSNQQEVIAEEVSLERRSKRFGVRGGNVNHMLDNILRNNSSSLDGERVYPVSDLVDDSHGQVLSTGPASPVKKWEPKIISQDSGASESSSRWPRSLKENSLTAKLLEARLEGRHAQAKGSK